MKWNEEDEAIRKVRGWRERLQTKLEEIPAEERAAWMQANALKILEREGINLPRKGVSKPGK